MARISKRWMLLLLGAFGCRSDAAPPAPAVPVPEAQRAHAAGFEREVVKVTDGVWVAVGYGLANAILLEGPEGVVVVDTLESAQAARPVKAAFDALTDKPVEAIVYTHNHTDHVFGAGVFAEGADPEVWAHASLVPRLETVATLLRPVIWTRSLRQFGVLLPDAEIVHAGIGPRLHIDPDSELAFLRPTRTFSGARTRIEVAGLTLELLHAPGETDDQIAVWLPDEKVLLPGDDFYEAFPNLYAIRGTPHRDVLAWVHSLDVMRDLGAEHLVPSHGRPVSGREAVDLRLTTYRDAIQYVHDQTVQGMQAGLDVDTLAATVRLPDPLARLPWLQAHYGTVPWSVRAIHDGYLGWFSGRSAELFPRPPAERARRLVELGGGIEAVTRKARGAADAGDAQWALELADAVLAVRPGSRPAREIKRRALEALAAGALSANARHWYLTEALETKGPLDLGQPPEPAPALVRGISLGALFRAMAVRLDAEAAAGRDETVAFRFPDTGEAWTVHVRHGVAEVRPRLPEKAGVTVTVDSGVWKEIAAGLRGPAMAVAQGELRVEGGTLDLVSFLRLFRAS